MLLTDEPAGPALVPRPRAVAVLGVALAPFGLLLALVRAGWEPLARLDGAVIDWWHARAVDHPLFVLGMKGVSFVGSAQVYWVLAAVLVAWLLYRRRPLTALFVPVAILGGSVLNGVVKGFVGRPRPVWADPVAHVGGLSFPSGHAQSAMVCYGVLLLVAAPLLAGRARQALVVVSVAMVLAIGVSRVALGVHYPSDVLGGYLLGVAWLSFLVAIGGLRHHWTKPL